MNSIVIAEVSILRDEHGRFSLNDLHRAAGGESKHRPNYWLDSKQVKELISEIEIAGISAIQSKQGLGTFAVKELVYAYAMWISPTFHLKVIRAYDATVTNQAVPQLPDFTNPAVAARAWADEVEAKQAALVQLEAAKPSVEFVQRDSEWGLMGEGIRCLRAQPQALQLIILSSPYPCPERLNIVHSVAS